jgi:hypothetical protein
VKDCNAFYGAPSITVGDTTTPSMGGKYNSKLYYNKYCLPDEDDDEMKTYYDLLSIFLGLGGQREYVNDLYRGWFIIFIGFIFSIILSFSGIYMIMSNPRKAYIINGIGCFLLLLSFSIIALYHAITTPLGRIWFKYYSILASILFLTLTIAFVPISIYYYFKLKFVIMIIDYASKFIKENRRIFYIPLFMYLIVGVFYTIWILTCIWLYNIAEVSDNAYQMKEVKWDASAKRGWYYLVFGLFWINNILLGVMSFAYVLVYCQWYFRDQDDEEDQISVKRALWWVFRYHLGTIIFGGLIVSFLQIITAILERYVKKAEEKEDDYEDEDDMPFYIKWFLKPKKLITFVYNLIKIINKSSFVNVAMTCDHYLKSSMQTFALLMRHK